MNCRKEKSLGAKRLKSEYRKAEKNGKASWMFLATRSSKACASFKTFCFGKTSKKSSLSKTRRKLTRRFERYLKARKEAWSFGTNVGAKNTTAFIPIGRPRTIVLARTLI